MGAGFLANTNAVIDFLSKKLPPVSIAWLEQLVANQRLALSVVVRIKMPSWNGPPAEMQMLERFIAACTVLPLNEPVIRQTIALRQQHRVKLPDAIIAATALAHGLPLLTRNAADSRRVAGLALLDPHDAAQLPAG